MRRRLYSRVGLWLLFAVLQVLGILIPHFTNIHSNIWPAFGLLLLVPGIALAAVFGLMWGVVLSIPVNAITWYFGLRLLEDKQAQVLNRVDE